MTTETINLLDKLIAQKSREIEIYKNLEMAVPEVQKVFYAEQLSLYQEISRLEQRKILRACLLSLN